MGVLLRFTVLRKRALPKEVRLEASRNRQAGSLTHRADKAPQPLCSVERLLMNVTTETTSVRPGVDPLPTN